MQLKYVDTKEEIIAINRKAKHIEPHLHKALEIVCVTSCLLYTSIEAGHDKELHSTQRQRVAESAYGNGIRCSQGWN